MHGLFALVIKYKILRLLNPSIYPLRIKRWNIINLSYLDLFSYYIFDPSKSADNTEAKMYNYHECNSLFLRV